MRSTTAPRTDVLLRGEETGGHVSLTEIVVPAHNAGPPLHTHDFDEAFYMLEGELVFQVEEELATKGAGEHSFAPRNVAHALANHSDAPARYVLVCTPAGFERHWARVAAEAAGVDPPEWALQPIPEITVVGPQIAAEGGDPRSRRPTR
jgi:quercetin dioxygenase-like cupin family protein